MLKVSETNHTHVWRDSDEAELVKTLRARVAELEGALARRFEFCPECGFPDVTHVDAEVAMNQVRATRARRG